MEASDFRAALASFAGPDRYRQFVRALNREGRWRGRFLYWQEDLLARYVATAPTADVAFGRVEPLLRVCELHEVELAVDPEALSQRCRGAVTEYSRTQAERFPNTDCGPVVMAALSVIFQMLVPQVLIQQALAIVRHGNESIVFYAYNSLS